ncbi:MAG: anthranilate phosphoribosyltransferase [bacterium]
MNLNEAIQCMLDRQDLSRDEMVSVMRKVMTGEATPAQIGGFLIGLRMKGETIDEITAAASVMRELATHVQVEKDNLVDTCGTGGDASGTFNVSTASAFVVAAAGGRVAKHGNRSISSKSGSADVLEEAGVNLALTPEQVAECIDKLGVGFLFAVNHHGAMKHAIGPRKEMGVRTLFNVLGPLTNPAEAPYQVLGVFSLEMVEPLAQVLKALGSKHVLVVHAEDGLDEISISGATYCAELKDGEVTPLTLHPEDLGVKPSSLESIKVSTAGESLAMIRQALSGEDSPAADIVAMNAGAAIYVAGLANSLREGVERAREVMGNGAALTRLEALAKKTQGYAA